MKSNGLKANFQLFGIFGHPLSHTLSPVMQEAGFEKIGLKAFYSAFDLEEKAFRKTCKNLPHLILDGFNVTVPYKQTVIPYLDRLTPEARAVGAVNTVFKETNRWTGTNTDIYGFATSLTREGKFKPRGKTAVVFGAGGAARAVLYGLAQQGIRSVCIINRNTAKAEKLTREFKKIFSKTNFRVLKPHESAADVLSLSDLAVNATSLGLSAEDPPVVNASAIPSAGRKAKLFFDLIYHAAETPFLKAAKKKGHRILGGKGMLLFQGVKAFELWTGRKAPVNEMRRALDAAIQGRSR